MSREFSTEFFSALESSIGPDGVDTTPEACARYGSNRLPGGDRQVAGVVMPATTADVAAAVRLAGEHGMTLWPTSTGQNLGLGEFSPVRSGQVVLHLGKRMNRVLDVDERLGFAVVEPGVTFWQLRAELRARGDKLMLSSTSGPPEGSILGNALDRGAGYTPYFDHFGMLCGLEVVLADGSVLHTGDGLLPGAATRFVNKSGFGPLLDGMFSQSNFGIATQAAIWLMPRPPAVVGFAFTFPEDDDLAEIIELVRPLKLSNAVPTLIKVTSDVYAFGTRCTYPFERTGGAIPLPDTVRRELREQHGTGAWTVTGALYGPSAEAVAPAIERIRAVFEGSGRATYHPHDRMLDDPLLRIHLDTFSGEPTDSELGLLNWRPGGGATWFLPATPMIGEVAQRQQELSRRILTEHGFEYVVEFVCGPRAARALHIIPFDRSDPAEVARMNAAYDALVAAHDAAGFPIGRTPVDRQEWAMQRLPQFQDVTSRIKGALDPHGIIAPGKYGIR
ncbi:FAD-binding oxidoreductase [Pseudonocardia sp. TRM90224]|uniref:FAD-binding oxidoreductase n=1 Tax=Pseudonocardia sp. TRM90224 TaxID=2812678 RepID=UPI001E44B878|nr:FAD-binding oxidoreductase [Pseudonocardia sp. TRM90224]